MQRLRKKLLAAPLSVLVFSVVYLHSSQIFAHIGLISSDMSSNSGGYCIEIIEDDDLTNEGDRSAADGGMAPPVRQWFCIEADACTGQFNRTNPRQSTCTQIEPLICDYDDQGYQETCNVFRKKRNNPPTPADENTWYCGCAGAPRIDADGWYN